MLRRFLLTVLLLATALQAQSCVPIADPNVQAGLASVAFCQPYLPTSGQVYFPSPYNVTGPAYPYLRVLGSTTPFYTGPGRTCIDAVIRELCSLMFPPCQILSGTNPQVTAYVQPCVSVCDATTACQASIGPTLASMNFSAPLPDLLNPLCNATIVPTAQYVGGQPLFGDTVWRVGGANFPVQCQTIQPTCPAKFYSLLPATNVWAQITGWIGVVLLPVVMALRLSIPKFRQFPANLVILMMWGWWMFSWGLVISTLAGGYRKVLCPKGFNVQGWWVQMPPAPPGTDLYGHACMGQATLLVLGGLTFLLSWTAVCVCSCIAVLPFASALRKTPTWLVTCMTWFASLVCVSVTGDGLCVILPIILAFTMLGMRTCGASGFHSLCYVAGGNQFEWGFVFAWIVICAFFSLASISIVLFRMSQVSDMGHSWHIKNNLRVVVFMFIGLVWAVFQIAERVYNTFTPLNIDGIIGDFFNWLGCSIFSRTYRPSEGAEMTFYVFWTIPSLLLPLFFMSNKELYTTPLSERTPPWASASGSATKSTTGSSSSNASGSSSTGAGESTWMSELQ